MNCTGAGLPLLSFCKAWPNSNREICEMADLFAMPIIVGITGKRDLRGKEAAVRRAICAAFDLLDKSLPASRKLLLSAFAAGADTIAAEEALGRKDWSLIAVLPLELELYARDFDEVGANTLRKLVADPRVKSLTLAALNDPRSGKPFSSGALARAAGKSNDDRTDHYEQVGLFIAERCALLIAVMDASEKPDRVGGTARVVYYRLHGIPDADARRVIARSRELRLQSELDCPQTGPVWLIDLRTTGNDPNPLRAISLWRAVRATGNTMADFWSRLLGLSSRTATDAVPVDKRLWRHANDLIERVPLLRRIDVFNGLVRDESLRAEIVVRSGNAAGNNACSALRWIRAGLSVIQINKKNQLTKAVLALGILFVFAVFCLEMHLTFHWPVSIYLVLFALILLLYWWAKVTLLQQFVEDYRAVSEALRVQLVWWEAGARGRDYCVDRYFLTGTTGSLGLVRGALRHAIAVAQFEHAPPSPAPSGAEDWISAQIKYFDSTVRKHEARLSWSEDGTWFLFIASAGMALMLWEGGARLLSPIGNWLAANPGLGAIVLLSLLILARVLSACSKLGLGGRVRAGFVVFGGVVALAWGGMFAAWGSQSAAGPFNIEGHQFAAVATTVTITLAGAIRFFTERLAWEPELHSYREALDTFIRARDQFAKLCADPSALAKQQEQIILELGRFALEETESWIRARRVRPIEPMH
jgi:hypothetical protein